MSVQIIVCDGCGQNGIVIGKYDSPNNCCSNAGGCGYYTTEVTR